VRLGSLQETCAGRRVLFLDKEKSLRRLGLRSAGIVRLDQFVLRQRRYVSNFDVVLYTNPESGVNRYIVELAEKVGVQSIYCLDGFYEFTNVCFNPRIRCERPFGTFVGSKMVAVRTLGEAVFFAYLGKSPLLITPQ
jgi:hypothetical protein